MVIKLSTNELDAMKRTGMAGFGEALKNARKAAGIELAELAETTKVQRRYIIALEEEDWDSVHGGVIGRGFVRLIAREVDADMEPLLELYAEARIEDATDTLHPQDETEWALHPSAREGRIKMIAVVAAVLLGSIIGVWIWSPWSVEEKPVAERFIKEHTLEVRALEQTSVTLTGPGYPSVEKKLTPANILKLDVGAEIKIEAAEASAIRISWDGVMLKAPGPANGPVTVELPSQLESLKP